MRQKFPANLSQCTWSHSSARSGSSLTAPYCLLCQRYTPCREANADPVTGSLEIASTGTALRVGAFVPADTGLRSLPCWEQAANHSVFQQRHSKSGHHCLILLRNRISSSLPKSLLPDILPCRTLLPDVLKLMVYCFGSPLCLKCCSWLLLVVIHHCSHYCDFFP